MQAVAVSGIQDAARTAPLPEDPSVTDQSYNIDLPDESRSFKSAGESRRTPSTARSQVNLAGKEPTDSVPDQDAMIGSDPSPINCAAHNSPAGLGEPIDNGEASEQLSSPVRTSAF